MVACAGLFTACSNEVDEVIGNGPDTKADAYLSVTFSIPNGISTRATGGENGDGEEIGTDVENEVKTADIFLFQNNRLVLSKKQLGVEFTGTGNSQPKEYKTAPFGVDLGTFNVYVIVNPEGSSTLTSLPEGTTLSEFQSKIFENHATQPTYCRNNQFLMTNAFEFGKGAVVGGNEGEGVVTITNANSTAETCANLVVSVERAAAKISFTPKNKNVYTLESGDKITLKSYKIINTRNSAWFLKRVGVGVGDVDVPVVGGDETAVGGAATNYVIENMFDAKKSFKNGAFDNDFFAKNYSRRWNTYVAWRKLPETAASEDNLNLIAYCMENTMHRDNQVKGLTTSIVFRAKVEPDADNVIGTMGQDGTFFRYVDGKLYASVAEVLKARYGVDNVENAYFKVVEEKYLGIDIKDTDADYLAALKAIDGDLTPENATEAQKKNAKANVAASRITTMAADTESKTLYQGGIEQFTQGFCYYTYLIKHSGQENVNGIMEFATVRNNVYKLSVNTISKIGDMNSGTNGPGEGDMIDDPKNPGEKIPGPGVDEPGHGGDGTGTNPEIPGDLDPSEPYEPAEPIIPFDPSNPDEKVETFMNVEVKVLNWIKRDNGIDL